MRLAFAVLLALPGVAAAGTFDIHPTDDLFARLHMLQAGDQVIVHAGTYTTPGLVMVTWAGTPQAPISVRAAPGEHVVIVGNSSQNVLDIGGSYFSAATMRRTSSVTRSSSGTTSTTSAALKVMASRSRPAPPA